MIWTSLWLPVQRFDQSMNNPDQLVSHLHAALDGVLNDGDHGAAHDHDQVIVADWNAWMENFLSPAASQLQTRCEEPYHPDFVVSAKRASLRLSEALVRNVRSDLFGVDGVKVTEFGFFEISDDCELSRLVRDRACDVVGHWSELDSAGMETQQKPQMLPLILQTCKNWLRYIILHHTKVTMAPSGENWRSAFQSQPMLELLMNLIDFYCEKSHVEASRHASLILFYAVFNPRPQDDDSVQLSLNFLIRERQYMERFLKNLLRAESAPLALALMRNVHHTVSSFPSGARSFLGTSVSMSKQGFGSDIPTSSPWVLTLKSRKQFNVSYLIVLRETLYWALNSQPPFPGPQGDQRSELVVEILRVLFSVRLGRVLTGKEQTEEENEGLGVVVSQILFLSNDDERSQACQQAAISLLIDSDASFADSLLAQNVFHVLLVTLDRLISDALAAGHVGDDAAAMLTPGLIVLTKYTQSNSVSRDASKHIIFPNPIPTAGSGPRKSMVPLDAPDGSLRANLIRLMTCPQSQIKRLAGELLWTLCDSNPEEFIQRVGFGNAVLILGSKGLLELPPQIFS